MKKYTIQQVKDLKPQVATVLRKLLTDILLTTDHRLDPFETTIVIDNIPFKTKYAPIFTSDHHHMCSHGKTFDLQDRAPGTLDGGNIEIYLTCNQRFTVSFTEDEFGKEPSEEDIDVITDKLITDMIAQGVEQYIKENFKEAIDSDFDKHMTIDLTGRAGGLIDVDYTNSYSYVQYVGTDGKVRFKNEFDDAIGMYSQWGADHYKEMTKRMYNNCFHHAIADEQIYPGILIAIRAE